ncbi:hypothetical protein [Micrococcus endophyticus]|uniref:hypothetical protein n=1 Tax=Micrococcus endophyticus TaxID=455343 RepID=UPI0034CD119E
MRTMQPPSSKTSGAVRGPWSAVPTAPVPDVAPAAEAPVSTSASAEVIPSARWRRECE